MNNALSILHISDLHRSSTDPISNDELISSLLMDRDRYKSENKSIASPDAIIVSGDIIQGVSLDYPDFETALAEQYKTAAEFLNRLVDEFLDGDKSKIIIIPGNHDVDWNTAFKAMEIIPESDIPKNFQQLLGQEDSILRWSWKERAAFKIIKPDLYEKRLDAFWKFFEDFYRGTTNLFKVQAKQDVNLFTLFDGRIGIAAFNSCHGNDCFAYHGRIKKEAIARSHLDFRNCKTIQLLIAVWHHNIDGPPYSTDYMDVEIVKDMIGRNFKLGIYGHQHKAQITPYEINLPDQQQRMTFVSAGSLCAGRYDLPSGYRRQYNILEIADNFQGVTVHVREMTFGNMFTAAALVENAGRSFIELSLPIGAIDKHTIQVDQARQVRQLTSYAEALIKSGKFEEALAILEGMEIEPASYQKELLLEAWEKLGKWINIITSMDNIQSISDLMLRVNAQIQLDDFAGAEVTVEQYAAAVELPAIAKTDLLKKIKYKLK
ncbi:metallophosphoesterase [Pedobacter sp. D749]|uniref:metallophosphoesterase family protein n=1 Tax=Pedobacter sp. D749 TaxID=2856523 RepID=UPI001C55AFD6|nr:metallophosphoesterase [Pedobacter sp. D749]QXU42802.1 metallophosphoesterase [Pedobacter sp. D749]